MHLQGRRGTIMETIALWYFKQAPLTWIPVWMGFLSIGIGVFVFSRRPLTRLSRVPYLNLLAVTMLTLVVSKNLWNESSYAIAEGRLWVPFLMHVGITAAVGYVLAFIGTARSLDLKQHANLTILAFVPLVNIAFGFFPGTSPNAVKRAYFDDFRGWIGKAALVFLAILIPGARSVYHDNVEEARQAFAADSENDIINLKVGLALWGLEEMLEGMAGLITNSHLPMRVDDQTVAVKVVATGDKITYVYMSETSGFELSDEVKSETNRNACRQTALQTFLEAGATVEYRFQSVDKRDIGTFEVVLDDCK